MTKLKTKILSYNLCYCINMMLGKDVDLRHIKELVFRQYIKNILENISQCKFTST